MLTVCLLTCGRPELTEQSVRWFMYHHPDRSALQLLHCDGGSADGRNVAIAREAGFTTLVAPPASERIGQMECLRLFMAYAAHPWTYWFENDWRCCAPLPLGLLLRPEFDRLGIETVRLFAKWKMPAVRNARSAAGTHRIGTDELISWMPHADFPGWEYGRAHWAGGGSLILTDILRGNLHHPRLKDVILAENDMVSLRPVENLAWSFGYETTPGMIG